MTNKIEQDWTGVSGANAFHLIDRNAQGWPAIGDMMEQWAAAFCGEKVQVLASQPEPTVHGWVKP